MLGLIFQLLTRILNALGFSSLGVCRELEDDRVTDAGEIASLANARKEKNLKLKRFFCLADLHRLLVTSFLLLTMSAADAVSEENHGTECQFASYSGEVLNTNDSETRSIEEVVGRFGDGERRYEKAYIAETSKIFLELISPNANLRLAKPGQADVAITYIGDDNPYKNLFDNRPTAADLLAALPKAPSDARTLSSPWTRLSLTPDCRLDAVFIYNMRQMIADQAFLAGVRPVVTGVVTRANDPDRPVVKEYEQLITFLGEDPYTQTRGDYPDDVEIDKRQEVARRLVSHEYPADLFWFFSLVKSNAWRTDDGTFYGTLLRNHDRLADNAKVSQAGLALLWQKCDF
jgi:hypothetical protein